MQFPFPRKLTAMSASVMFLPTRALHAVLLRHSRRTNKILFPLIRSCLLNPSSENVRHQINPIIDNIDSSQIEVTHHSDTEDCTEDCGFELQLALELCLLSGDAPLPPPGSTGVEDEATLSSCLQNTFSADCKDCLCDTLANEGTPCDYP